MTFEQTGLQEEILRATHELGFINTTPIQELIIPLILETPKDIIAIAQTGTGKTAAFGLPLIQLTDMNILTVQTIVLCPTRELCMQITGDMERYARHVSGFKTVAVYGGADIRKQIHALKDGCQVVVGTPGRVMDMIRRKALHLSTIRWVVLDEADEMLNMGFKEELDSILAETPKEKRTLLFSATMPREITVIAKRYMKDAEEVSAGNRNCGADNVRHEYYMVQAKDRYAALKRIADIYPNIYGIVFCRTRQITGEIAEKLMSDGYNADALHGDLSQAQRDHVMNRFRHKQLQLLVATDVAARGLDVNDLTHIINYDLPDDNEIYIHRTGRTARAGKSGIAVSIIHSREGRKIRDIERLTGKRFEMKPVPTGTEICEKQLFNLIDRVEKVEVDDHRIDRFLPVIFKKLEWLSREELIKHFVSVEFNRFLSYYKDTPDLNVAPPEERKRDRHSKRNYVSFRVSAGHQHGLNAASLIGLINQQTRSRNILIGKINIGQKTSFFEVDKDSAHEIMKSFKNARFNDAKITVEGSKQENGKKPSEASSEKGWKKRKKKPSSKTGW